MTCIQILYEVADFHCVYSTQHMEPAITGPSWHFSNISYNYNPERCIKRTLLLLLLLWWS